jgi:hypothetical protein
MLMFTVFHTRYYTTSSMLVEPFVLQVYDATEKYACCMTHGMKFRPKMKNSISESVIMVYCVAWNSF